MKKREKAKYSRTTVKQRLDLTVRCGASSSTQMAGRKVRWRNFAKEGWRLQELGNLNQVRNGTTSLLIKFCANDAQNSRSTELMIAPAEGEKLRGSTSGLDSPSKQGFETFTALLKLIYTAAEAKESQ